MAVKGQRRRRRPHRHHKSKVPTNKSLNKKIHHIENTLMELKFIDSFDNVSLIPPTGIQDYLIPVAQGDTASNRTGSIINPTSVQIRMSLETDVDQNAPCRVRCVLFWDRQPNNAAPTLTGASTTLSLLDTGTITDTTLAPFNYNNKHRYHVLMDKVIQFNPQVVLTTVTGGTTQVVQMERTKYIIKKLGRVVKYNGTGATIASCSANSLFIAYFSDVVAAANQPFVSAGYRVYYRDA